MGSQMEKSATVIVDREPFLQPVFEDDERYRKVLAPSLDDLPDRATVKWMGNTYRGELTFRYVYNSVRPFYKFRLRSG
jgi:hypothetical protein